MKLNTALAAVLVAALALSTSACVVHDDGFRDHLAKGCHSKEECHTLAIQAHNRNAKCKKSSCRDEAEDEQTANALEAPYVNQPSTSRSTRREDRPLDANTIFAKEYERAKHVAAAFTGKCEEDEGSKREAESIDPSVQNERRAGLQQKIIRGATEARARRWAGIAHDIESSMDRPAIRKVQDIDGAVGRAHAARARLPELRCGENQSSKLETIDARITSELKALEEERACRASDDCMAKRYAQPLCSALELKRNTAKEMARERANPSGVVNLTALNDLGRQSQDAEESIAEARKEYASKTKKPFNESMCK